MKTVGAKTLKMAVLLFVCICCLLTCTSITCRLCCFLLNYLVWHQGYNYTRHSKSRAATRCTLLGFCGRLEKQATKGRLPLLSFTLVSPTVTQLASRYVKAWPLGKLQCRQCVVWDVGVCAWVCVWGGGGVNAVHAVTTLNTECLRIETLYNSRQRFSIN